ncbi:MAG: hypothetical protein QXY45_00160 [Candidatus Aenigmatarchaeota archaeon]
MDLLIFVRNGKSPIVNKPKAVFKWSILSIIFWVPFELLNFYAKNWIYSKYTLIVHLVDFTIIFTAVWMTHLLFSSFDFFQKIRIKPIKIKPCKTVLIFSIILGIFFFVGPIISPYYLFFGMWLFPIFLFEPINYLNGKKSIINHLRDGKIEEILSVMLSGFVCGILWEFWNFWAYPKWFYNIPLLHNLGPLTPITSFKIFEMYLPGYLGYLPFGLSLYCMYYFSEFVFEKIKSI